MPTLDTQRPGVPLATPAAGFFIPPGFFSQARADALPSIALARSLGPTPAPAPREGAPLVPDVLLYDSPTTRAFFASGGLDAQANLRVWEVFLRKYGIPFRVLVSPEQLAQAQLGVLLLPSSVALSASERRAVIEFRDRGGSVLSSWLTGVRGERGAWQGLDFMASALGVQVAGTTEDQADASFMMPYGDNPVTHSLPAGLRVWLERVPGLYPLRLVSPHPAAHIMDWSRTVVAGQAHNAVLVFNEHLQASGRWSRSVVLGYPERLWLSAAPQLLEAIAHNALLWLLRQPDVYKAAWPYPYASAMTMAVDEAETFQASDLDFAKRLEDVGGRATFHVLSEGAQKSADILKKLQARGHEIAYLGDSFSGFKGQSLSVQAKRLDTMRQGLKDAGLPIAPEAGFHAPMESYDRITEKLLKERDFGYYVSFMDATEARLPFFADEPAAPEGAPAPGRTLVLPRTQNGPDDVMELYDPEEALPNFMAELRLADQMGGLSFLRLPNQTLLSDEELTEIFGYFKTHRDRMWLATGGQVARWWRARERVSARLTPDAAGVQLNITLHGDSPLRDPVAVWVNLPELGSLLRLQPVGDTAAAPRVAPVDAWRSAIVLEGLAPGEHQWVLRFDRPASNAVK